jgi:Pilus formation protein N terminal region
MSGKRGRDRLARSPGRRLSAAVGFAVLLAMTAASLAEQLTPLTVEQEPRQTIVLTEGFSTTIHSERPFGKISITNPDIVDLVLRTDKSAVLIPQHLGRTNVDFLDDNGSVISSVIIVVNQQKTPDRVQIFNHPSLGAFSSYHCVPTGCQYFEEIPAKEQAQAPSAPEDRQFTGGPPGMPGIPGMPGMPPQ